jgi:hypothetical protein
MHGEVFDHLLERIYLGADADETYDVPGDAAGQCYQLLLGPTG